MRIAKTLAAFVCILGCSIQASKAELYLECTIDNEISNEDQSGKISNFSRERDVINVQIDNGKFYLQNETQNGSGVIGSVTTTPREYILIPDNIDSLPEGAWFIKYFSAKIDRETAKYASLAIIGLNLENNNVLITKITDDGTCRKIEAHPKF